MMKEFEPLLYQFFDHSKTIPVSSVPFDPEVRRLCEQNMCGSYGTSWTCPPAVEAIEKLQSDLFGFDRCVIFYKVYSLKDSFDWQGMMISVKDFQSKILKFKKSLQNQNPEFDFLILGAGACQLCDTCTYSEHKPCRNPEDALFSVEAFGIDAVKMMMENALNYNNGPNTVTYIGILFHH